jgi:hypothetical protein
MTTNLGISGVCKAFDDACVGTRVVSTRRDFVKSAIASALSTFDMPANGQGFIPLSSDVCEALYSGDCERKGLQSSEYVAREWRGEVMLFAERKEVRPTFAAAVVYTREAYFADPEVDEAERERLGDATHVLVALLGSRGPKPTLSSTRFVRNLAGGNASFVPGQRSYEDLVEMAKEIVVYESTWITVADDL